MQKEFLEQCLAEGMSLEAIGKRAGKHESTVSYWLKKHGLEAARSQTHAPNAKVDPQRLAGLVERGASIQEMGDEFGLDDQPFGTGSANSVSRRSGRLVCEKRVPHAKRARGVPISDAGSMVTLRSTRDPKVDSAADAAARKRSRSGDDRSRGSLSMRLEGDARSADSMVIRRPCSSTTWILRPSLSICLREDSAGGLRRAAPRWRSASSYVPTAMRRSRWAPRAYCLLIAKVVNCAPFPG